MMHTGYRDSVSALYILALYLPGNIYKKMPLVKLLLYRIHETALYAVKDKGTQD
jgi:hypothetical protein